MKTVVPLLCAFLVSASALGCGGDPLEAYTLRIIAEDGSMGGDPVIQNAVDEMTVVLIPSATAGQRFGPLEPTAVDEGVEARVSAAGEFQLRIGKVYLDRNAEPSGTTFQIDIPLQGDQMDDTGVTDPAVRVSFIRRGEEIARGERPFLLWPLPPGGIDTIRVRCNMDMRLQCQNNDP